MITNTTFENKTILITGGTGSWGNELTKQLITDFNPKEIRIYARGEHKHVDMKRKFNNNPKLNYIIGDVRDRISLSMACKKVDIIFHLAALKHVPVCEEHPWEAIKTNVLGVQNVIEAGIKCDVEKVVDVSTDKAVNPLNHYGLTKACGERMIIAANRLSNKTIFSCVRGGNVLGTAGSVIPLFRKQIDGGGPITITSLEMTRFLFSVEHAISLVLNAVSKAVGGEIFVMKMPAVRITDLAEVLIESLSDKNSIKTQLIGIRPGEKIHEVLISEEESKRVIEDDPFYIILPMLGIPKILEYYKNAHHKEMKEYSSNNNNNFLSKIEIHEVLRKSGWLNKDSSILLGELRNLNKEQLLNFFRKEGWGNYIA